MRRFIVVMAGLAIFVLGLLPATSARADSDDDSITRYAVTADAAKDGTTAVTLDFDFNFGSDEGHGPYITLPLRQEIANDPDHWRMVDVTVGEVSSPSGASADVQTETKDGNLLIRVGDENRTWSDRDLPDQLHDPRPDRPEAGPVGAGRVQLERHRRRLGGADPRITAKVTGPADVVRAACFVDNSTTDTCDSATASGTSATFAESSLPKETPLQIVAGFPGALSSAPRLDSRSGSGSATCSLSLPSPDPSPPS